MANRDPSDDAHEARTPASPQAAGAISQPGDQTSSLAEEVVPLFDIINTFLEELPIMREFMPYRHARALLMSDGGTVHRSESLRYLLKVFDRLTRTDHDVLVIEDIDAERFRALATHFPASLNVRFLAHHVLRLGELKAIYDWHDSMRDGYETLVSRVDAEISRRLSDTAVNKDYDCQHIDGRVARHGINDGSVQKASPRANGYRWETFTK
jgi:hypothetical protein